MAGNEVAGELLEAALEQSWHSEVMLGLAWARRNQDIDCRDRRVEVLREGAIVLVSTASDAAVAVADL